MCAQTGTDRLLRLCVSIVRVLCCTRDQLDAVRTLLMINHTTTTASTLLLVVHSYQWCCIAVIL
jgi:hypothetical protein